MNIYSIDDSLDWAAVFCIYQCIPSLQNERNQSKKWNQSIFRVESGYLKSCYVYEGLPHC